MSNDKAAYLQSRNNLALTFLKAKIKGKHFYWHYWEKWNYIQEFIKHVKQLRFLVWDDLRYKAKLHDEELEKNLHIMNTTKCGMQKLPELANDQGLQIN